MILENTYFSHPKCDAVAFDIILGVLLEILNADNIYSCKTFPKRI